MKTCVTSFQKMTLIFLFLISPTLQAANLGFAVGLKSDSATANNPAVNVDSRSGYNFGVNSLFEMGPQIYLRLGFLYTPRTYGLTAGDVKLTYVDIPAGLMWKFSDFGGAFIGANAAMNVSASCPGNCTNLANVASGYQFGVQFKFAPQMGAALYYEAMSALVTNIENPKSVAAQFLYTFE